MEEEEEEAIVPSVSYYVDSGLSKDELEEIAGNMLAKYAKGKVIEIVDIRVSPSPMGKNVQTCTVWFLRKDNVVYLHPRYLEIMDDYSRRRGYYK